MMNFGYDLKIHSYMDSLILSLANIDISQLQNCVRILFVNCFWPIHKMVSHLMAFIHNIVCPFIQCLVMIIVSINMN
jgi:hypothetical protein